MAIRFVAADDIVKNCYCGHSYTIEELQELDRCLECNTHRYFITYKDSMAKKGWVYDSKKEAFVGNFDIGVGKPAGGMIQADRLEKGSFNLFLILEDNQRQRFSDIAKSIGRDTCIRKVGRNNLYFFHTSNPVYVPGALVDSFNSLCKDFLENILQKADGAK